MNILIVGCGHVGAALARDLENEGHDVSILDKNSDNFRRLDSFDHYTFGGTATTGDPTDRAALTRAGIQNCDAVAVVGQSDAENLMAAQIAQKVFGKKNVTCRVSQQELADIYKEKYNLTTICPTALTVRATFETLSAQNEVSL